MSLFSNGNSPLTIRPPSDWLRLFSNEPFSRMNTPATSSQLFFQLISLMKMEQTACSETSGNKIQTSGNHPKERIQHSEHGESLKSRIKDIIKGLKQSVHLTVMQ
jgi:hypothetical protein